MAAMSPCAESGFGPASTPLELQRIEEGSVPPGGGGGGVVPPIWMSCHCWFAPFQSKYCTTLAPFAVEAPCTSATLLLWRATSRT